MAKNSLIPYTLSFVIQTWKNEAFVRRQLECSTYEKPRLTNTIPNSLSEVEEMQMKEKKSSIPTISFPQIRIGTIIFTVAFVIHVYLIHRLNNSMPCLQT